jgi:hypothetical protein
MSRHMHVDMYLCCGNAVAKLEIPGSTIVEAISPVVYSLGNNATQTDPHG